MQRTLKKIVGKGRRCQYGDRPLRPNVEYVRVLGHLREIPTAEQLVEMGQLDPSITHVRDAVLYGYLKERVFRFRHSSTWAGRPALHGDGLLDGRLPGQGLAQGRRRPLLQPRVCNLLRRRRLQGRHADQGKKL